MESLFRLLTCPCSKIFTVYRKNVVCQKMITAVATCSNFIVVVVVVFTLTDRASTIPSNIRGCQSGTWSQRGTKVNASYHGNNPLLRPTGIQIATKVMRLYKRWQRPLTKRFIKPPLLHIESSLDRLGFLSPFHDQRSQQQIGQIRSNQF